MSYSKYRHVIPPGRMRPAVGLRVIGMFLIGWFLKPISLVSIQCLSTSFSKFVYVIIHQLLRVVVPLFPS